MSTQSGKLTSTRIAATTTFSARRDPSTGAGSACSPPRRRRSSRVRVAPFSPLRGASSGMLTCRGPLGFGLQAREKVDGAHQPGHAAEDREETGAARPLPGIQDHLVPGPQVQLIQREAATDRVLKRIAGPYLDPGAPYEGPGRISILRRPSRYHDRVGRQLIGRNL